MVKRTFRLLGPYWPAIFALVLFGLLVFFAVRFTTFKKDQWIKDARSSLQEVLVAKKTRLEKALYSRIHYTRSVAAYISLHPDVGPVEFSNLAQELIQNDPVISTMALSPGCIIAAVYPMKGHEAALGLNLLEHPERKEIVDRTIRTQESYVAGPVELIEGGVAFISYTPIFDKTQPDTMAFWGVTDIVIMRDRLLDEARIQEEEGGNLFALRGYNGSGNQGEIFWGNSRVVASHPVEVSIDLPNGSWVLAAVPANGWDKYMDQDRFLFLILICSSLIISVLMGMILHAVNRIRKSERNLARLNATKDKLFGIIAHDLRSPFNTLLGFTDILDEQFESLSDLEVRNMLRSLRKTTGETYELLSNLLNWSQLQRGSITTQPQSTSMQELADHSLRLAEGAAHKKGITLINLTSMDHYAFCDEQTCSLILNNILSNAIKFTPRNGTVTVESHVEGDRIALSVTDTGIGIPEEEISRLFSLRQTRTRKGTENETGTGLGLILCKEFAALNGGSIQVSSPEGGGSRFTLILPRKRI